MQRYDPGGQLYQSEKPQVEHLTAPNVVGSQSILIFPSKPRIQHSESSTLNPRSNRCRIASHSAQASTTETAKPTPPRPSQSTPSYPWALPRHLQASEATPKLLKSCPRASPSQGPAPPQQGTLRPPPTTCSSPAPFRPLDPASLFILVTILTLTTSPTMSLTISLAVTVTVTHDHNPQPQSQLSQTLDPRPPRPSPSCPPSYLNVHGTSTIPLRTRPHQCRREANSRIPPPPQRRLHAAAQHRSLGWYGPRARGRPADRRCARTASRRLRGR